MKIYLDVCCLNRPFDDQTQDRIHLEAEAILSIMKFIEIGQWRLVNSDGIFYEINKIPDPERKAKVQFMLSKAIDYVQINEGILERAKQIQELGVKSFDALHIACAESGPADIFLTTDDQLLKKLRQNFDKINVKVNNPLDWIKEII
ncbi:MAG: type II toxin-antitoxin system VapC family toxin [Calditrichaeota bacterium]|nr:type II toxin-antitoxin system VapC family toxin [Calditrichota bacterium]